MSNDVHICFIEWRFHSNYFFMRNLSGIGSYAKNCQHAVSSLCMCQTFFDIKDSWRQAMIRIITRFSQWPDSASPAGNTSLSFSLWSGCTFHDNGQNGSVYELLRVYGENKNKAHLLPRWDLILSIIIHIQYVNWWTIPNNRSVHLFRSLFGFNS